MDAVTLYYKVLPWFWKIEWIPCFHQYPCASKYFGWSFLFAEIWRISYTVWFQCCEWDNTHPCILSCCHGLVTGTNNSPPKTIRYVKSNMFCPIYIIRLTWLSSPVLTFCKTFEQTQYAQKLWAATSISVNGAEDYTPNPAYYLLISYVSFIEYYEAWDYTS